MPPSTCSRLLATKARAPAGEVAHIILIHDESSFDIRMAPGIKVPDGYGAHFKSFDGKERNFCGRRRQRQAEAGSPNTTCWKAFRRAPSAGFSYFVTRIAVGRVERGLPAALRRCGYRTFSLYPALGAFMSARSFQTTTGVQHFFDQHDLGTKDIEPDSFFFDAAARMIGQEHARSPMFVFVSSRRQSLSLGTIAIGPTLMPQWKSLGNVPPVDEYLRLGRRIQRVELFGFCGAAEARVSQRAVPLGAVRRSSAGFRRAPDRARPR